MPRYWLISKLLAKAVVVFNVGEEEGDIVAVLSI